MCVKCVPLPTLCEHMSSPVASRVYLFLSLSLRVSLSAFKVGLAKAHRNMVS